MKQLFLFPKENEKICAFTGHRALEDNFNFVDLDEAIQKQLRAGVRTFLNGMAVGFDLMAAELLLSHREEYPNIRLIACIPCEGQDKYYSPDDKIRYYNVLLLAEKLVFSERYHKGCMLIRDDYMAKNANVLISYCRKKEGGTAYTVNKFLKYHPDGELISL